MIDILAHDIRWLLLGFNNIMSFLRDYFTEEDWDDEEAKWCSSIENAYTRHSAQNKQKF